LSYGGKGRRQKRDFQAQAKARRCDELWTKFTDATGTPMGAFYAYVTKVR